jgi:hypothetical protein
VTDKVKEVVPTHFGQLKSLEWMVGQWTGDADNAEVELDCNWTKNQNFLTRTFKITIDGNAFDLAGYSSGLFDVAHDRIKPIREKRVVLDIWPAHETGIQVCLALVENLPVDCVERLLDAISCHDALTFQFSTSTLKQLLARW